ncbi:MAG: aminoacyl-tRNA hydrolase [Solirubrobacteraceae bacterium]
MRLPGRRGGGARGSGAPVDWLIVGLGNPGAEYKGSPHNIGFEVAQRLNERWDLGKPKSRYRGLLTEGRIETVPTHAGHARVAVLMPQTYMNEAGKSVGPARGELKVDLDHLLVIHDEIDLPFGDIRVRLGGGLAGHNGLKSLKQSLGSADFHRVRVGVGRPPTTDPDRVAAYVLGKFREPRADVDALIDTAADAAQKIVEDPPGP